MELLERIATHGTLLDAHCGPGTVARQLAAGDGWVAVSTLTVASRESFGGDWDREAQLWIALEGHGELASGADAPRPFRAGDAAHFAAGELRRIHAATRMTVLVLSAPTLRTICGPAPS